VHLVDTTCALAFRDAFSLEAEADVVLYGGKSA